MKVNVVIVLLLVIVGLLGWISWGVHELVGWQETINHNVLTMERPVATEPTFHLKAD